MSSVVLGFTLARTKASTTRQNRRDHGEAETTGPARRGIGPLRLWPGLIGITIDHLDGPATATSRSAGDYRCATSAKAISAY